MGRPISGWTVGVGAALMALGVSVPVLFQSGCDGQLRPQTAAEAFRTVCLAAVAYEADKRQTDLTDRALRYCADPSLPSRIVTLLELAQQLQAPLAPELAPLADAGL